MLALYSYFGIGSGAHLKSSLLLLAQLPRRKITPKNRHSLYFIAGNVVNKIKYEPAWPLGWRYARTSGVYYGTSKMLAPARGFKVGDFYYSISDLSESASNFAFIVGFPWVNFFMVRSSALLFARRRLFSDDNSASFVF